MYFGNLLAPFLAVKDCCTVPYMLLKVEVFLKTNLGMISLLSFWRKNFAQA